MSPVRLVPVRECVGVCVRRLQGRAPRQAGNQPDDKVMETKSKQYVRVHCYACILPFFRALLGLGERTLVEQDGERSGMR